MNNSDNNSDLSLLVLVSSQVVGEQAAPVGFAFRSEASNDQDSGWNFWSGEETEEFVQNPENFIRYTLQEFVELDESLLEILEAEIGTSWERDPESESWVEVEDD